MNLKNVTMRLNNSRCYMVTFIKNMERGSRLILSEKEDL